MESLYLVAIAVIAIFAFILCVILFNFFGLWIRARIANAPVSLGKMVGMRLRKVPVGFIVDNRITAAKAGVSISSGPLEGGFFGGGGGVLGGFAPILWGKEGAFLRFLPTLAVR